jgi:glycerol uptake facilitator protein
VADVSGAHINPAVTIGLATAGSFPWAEVPGYIAAQLAGGVLGAILVWLFYHQHYRVTDDADVKLATFCTAPSIRSLPANFFCEAVGTFMLVFPIFRMATPELVIENGNLAMMESARIGLGSLGALPVGLLVFAIGMSLGGTTGYAINPARDLGPRIAHALLPIPGKRDSDWSYAPIPVLGPIAGGLLAAALHGTLEALA